MKKNRNLKSSSSVALNIHSPKVSGGSINNSDLDIDDPELDSPSEEAEEQLLLIFNVWNHYKKAILDRSEFLRNRQTPLFNLMMGHIIYNFVEVLAQNKKSKLLNVRELAFGIYKPVSKIYNLTQAAKELDLPKHLILQELRAGRIFGAKVNGKWQITQSELDFIIFSVF